MKKKVIALLMTVMLCLSLAVPCFATSFSEEEVISRKRAYYPFIDESLSLLYNLRPLAKEAQIDRVFISSTGDYCTPDIIESKRSEASSQNYPVEICIHMNNYNSDGEWIFLNVLANDKLYEFGKFTAYADDISLDVTTAYQSLLNITKGFGILIDAHVFYLSVCVLLGNVCSRCHEYRIFTGIYQDGILHKKKSKI